MARLTCAPTTLPMSRVVGPTPNRLRLWQQNLNKSRVAQEDLINSGVYKDYDVLILQEPFIDSYGNTKATNDWRVVYPTSFLSRTHPTRSVMLVKTALDTNRWAQLSIPGTGDIVGIQMNTGNDRVTLFGIYNDCHHSDSLHALDGFIKTHQAEVQAGPLDHVFWCGDFNRHHPMWDEERNRHLFTAAAIREAELLLELLADHRMVMALPKDIPTLEAMATKNWTRPDNVFCTCHTEETLVSCTTDPRLRGPGTDHVPILVVAEFPVGSAPQAPTRNFRMTDWAQFKEVLLDKLGESLTPRPLTDEASLLAAVSGLDSAIQDAVCAAVPLSKPSPHSKRWWNNELSELKKKKNKLSSTSYKYRALPDHPAHEEHRKIRNLYSEGIRSAKKEHWASFLETMTPSSLWVTNRYISGDANDGGKTRIPTLKLTPPAGSGGQTTEAASNEEKSEMLVKLMFPDRPTACSVPDDYSYPPQLQAPASITADQIRRHIGGLSPYKAPGPDGIPNVVLKMCADIITPYLVSIFRAVLKLQLYPDSWKESTTCILRKPGKERYDVPKAYRPVALLNTVAKLLSSIVAEEMSYLTESHQLIPATHFGGRPGRTTTDSLHLLVDTIKAAWRRHQVVSVLFLDIEGAFPNAVTDRLLHNLRKRRVPEVFVKYIRGMLTGRRTRLRFDDYTSAWFELDNGIGQGDPLSMLLYLYYNSDLLEIPKGRDELGLGYVDDMALVSIAKDFGEAHRGIRRMMDRAGGAMEWSGTHNSRFEATKSVLVDFTRSKSKRRPPMELSGVTLAPQPAHKFLGVSLDQELRWNHQASNSLAKATKWVMAFRRLAHPSAGIRPRLMKQLYNAVAIPRMTYAADVWYTPIYKQKGRSRANGSVGVTGKLASLQRMATAAITGALRSTATDILDLHAGVLPMGLLLRRICHGAVLRLASLPASHPLHKPAIIRAKRYIKTHRSPLHELAHIFGVAPQEMETVSPPARSPSHRSRCALIIPATAEESANHASQCTAELKVYSDGSGTEGGAGAAAALLKTGQEPRILTYHLGTLDDHTTFEAEAIGLSLALHMIRLDRHASSAAIRLDNQAVIQSLQYRKPRPSQYIINFLLLQIEDVLQHATDPDFVLSIVWVKGHIDVEGNELVDGAAKAAAAGESSQEALLPPEWATSTLPASISARKQAYKMALHRQWRKDWSSSPRYAKMSRIDPSLPSNKYKQIIAELSRAQSSLIIQLRSGHIPLNAYLHRISKRDSPICTHCKDGDETVHHFLFDCTTWSYERWPLSRRLGRASRSLATLLGTKKGVDEVLKYIGRTGRFKAQAR
jgi:ribonuclease HI